nr:thioredoxin domain-containing protein [Desulfobulbaceae bacterium]
MLKLYPNDVKLVFKNFPLRSHQFAEAAGLAALAAGKQGKFWQMHDAIFENYNKLNNEKITELAQQIGLDMVKFEADSNDTQLKKQVQLDLQSGYAAGVRGTPTLFVNGRRVKQRSVEGLRQMVDKELANR